MFLAHAKKFIKLEKALLFGHSGGKTSRFRPGQPLHPAGDVFLREKIQPSVEGLISPFEDYVIRGFDFVNVIFLTTFVQLFQWIGTWDLLSYYAWPYEDLITRDGLYFGVGMWLILVSMKYFNLDMAYEDMNHRWEHGIPYKFGWGRKTKSFLRKNLNFLGYLFVWVGAWDYIDTKIVDEDLFRDIMYVGIPIFGSFILEELLSPESLYYVAAWSGRKQKGRKRCCGVGIMQPNQMLYPSQDYFLTNVVHPAVKKYISPFEDWVISIFNWINSIFFVTIIQLFLWVGMWDLFSYYVWPYDNTTYRDLAYCVVGFLTMFISFAFFSTNKSFEEMEDKWHDGLPIRFGIRRKFRNYLREMLNFIGFLFVWVGAWDYLDTYFVEDSLLRNIFYVIAPLPFSYLFEEILAVESIYYLVVQFKGTTAKIRDREIVRI